MGTRSAICIRKYDRLCHASSSCVKARRNRIRLISFDDRLDRDARNVLIGWKKARDCLDWLAH